MKIAISIPAQPYALDACPACGREQDMTKNAICRTCDYAAGAELAAISTAHLQHDKLNIPAGLEVDEETWIEDSGACTLVLAGTAPPAAEFCAWLSSVNGTVSCDATGWCELLQRDLLALGATADEAESILDDAWESCTADYHATLATDLLREWRDAQEATDDTISD